jgi:superfamily II DNA or RNA helicase
VELPVEIVSARAVRELIARAVLGDEASSDQSPAIARGSAERLGSVVLRQHQISAVSRLGVALDQFGGALLADEVGMGKTFVALALARRFMKPLVTGPAVLRDMWMHQERLAGVEIPFVSFESLSRGHCVDGSFDLVVIDEAHHLRNPATRRYRRLSAIARRARVLMISATPVHNRRRDLAALLAIFLGSRADSLSSSDLSRVVIRRGVESAGLRESMPQVGEIIWRELADDASVPAALLSLPPALPTRGAGIGDLLIARSLIRQWCSSDAALEAALRRRLARSIALISALESGHYPSQEELSAWTVADGSVQLAFPEIIATPRADTTDLLGTVNKHRQSLRELLHSLDGQHSRDKTRATFLRDIRRAHHNVPVAAFSQYAETVNAFFRELHNEPGIAVLTAKGARVAGGPLTRREALSRFAPRASGAPLPRMIERVDVLLATDLLSEGVNLQDAGVVVHLDLPWTAARLEQRMGRVARMGSAHRHVYAYGIRPPAAAEILIRLESTIVAKLQEAEATVGSFHSIRRNPFSDDVETTTCGEPGCAAEAPAVVDERIRSVLRRWLPDNALSPVKDLPLTSAAPCAATVASRHRGFLAICAKGSAFTLFASDGHGIENEPSKLLDLLLDADGAEVPPGRETIVKALHSLQSHLRTERTVALTHSQSAVAARARRVALLRVSAIVQRARPHARGRVLELAAAARQAILGRLGIAAEAELLRHVKVDQRDEDWLIAVGDDASGAIEAEPENGLNDQAKPIRVLAILMLEPDDVSE